uniref:Uncharacterized protein n=1 Tax=Candidozyma auris TaxID=498019 RepID=A0A0L0NU12_CANAR
MQLAAKRQPCRDPETHQKHHNWEENPEEVDSKFLSSLLANHGLAFNSFAQAVPSSSCSAPCAFSDAHYKMRYVVQWPARGDRCGEQRRAIVNANVDGAEFAFSGGFGGDTLFVARCHV